MSQLEDRCRLSVTGRTLGRLHKKSAGEGQNHGLSCGWIFPPAPGEQNEKRPRQVGKCCSEEPILLDVDFRQD